MGTLKEDIVRLPFAGPLAGVYHRGILLIERAGLAIAVGSVLPGVEHLHFVLPHQKNTAIAFALPRFFGHVGGAEFEVKLAVAKAKAANMPNDRISSAVKKGSGEDGGADFIELTYEGYAPGGVGMMIEVTTDNKNRSASDVRSTFTKNHGQMAEPGAVGYNFNRMGQFLIAADKVEGEDQLMELALEAGAQDVKNHGDHFEDEGGRFDHDQRARAHAVRAAHSSAWAMASSWAVISSQIR